MHASGLIGAGPAGAPTQAPDGRSILVRAPCVMRIRAGVIESITLGADAVGSSQPGYRRIDLDGCVIGPGFVDAHVHATSTGLLAAGLDLRGMRSGGAVLAALADACRHAPSAVHLGHGWDETLWSDTTMPTRHQLDVASNGGLVYLSRADVHSALVSTALRAKVPDLIELPGFDADGPLSRDAHGAVRRVALAAAGSREAARAHRAFRDSAARLGIVAAHEMAGPLVSSADDLAALLALAQEEPGPLIRGYWGQLAAAGGITTARELGAIGVGGDLFVDGAIGSRTACLREPYHAGSEPHTVLDAQASAHPGTTGAQYLSVEDIADHVAAATAAGLQAGFHVIGDAATDAVCAGLAAAHARSDPDAFRALGHRVEHIEMLDVEQAECLAGWGITASVQPVFDALWGGTSGMYAQRLGHERAERLNPFASMVRAGLRLAFGSDSPVTHLGPWDAIEAAIAHHTADERISAVEAFAAHTVHGWLAAGERGGRLAVGEPAHLAVWRMSGRDLAEAVAERPTCVLTLVHGATIYEGTL